MKRSNLLCRVGLCAAVSLLLLGAQGSALAARGVSAHAGFGGRAFAGAPGRGFYGRGFGYGRYGYGGGFYGCCGWGWGLGAALWLSVLPWDYETLWWNGAPYYYANNSYYTWVPQANAYEQVQPPAPVARQASTQTPAQTELFAYPKNGQSDQQQATDKSECRAWARSQSGYNPADAATVPAPAISSDQGASPAAQAAVRSYGTPSSAAVNPQFAKRADYLRAEAACLNGRGYSVQ